MKLHKIPMSTQIGIAAALNLFVALEMGVGFGFFLFSDNLRFLLVLLAGMAYGAKFSVDAFTMLASLWIGWGLLARKKKLTLVLGAAVSLLQMSWPWYPWYVNLHYYQATGQILSATSDPVSGILTYGFFLYWLFFRYRKAPLERRPAKEQPQTQPPNSSVAE
ncbi:MAG: hypothetical protein P8Z49_04235 [Acidobacteriota bacterium]|jgi:hypothetical protein